MSGFCFFCVRLGTCLYSADYLLWTEGALNIPDFA